MITFGKTTISIKGAKAMGERDFKQMFKGIISTDINYAWELINKNTEPVMNTNEKLNTEKSINGTIPSQNIREGINPKKKKSFQDRLELDKKIDLNTDDKAV